MQSKTGDIQTLHQITVALFAAIEDRQLSQIKVLLDKGADLAALNHDDKTPMQYAASFCADDWSIVEAIAKSRHTDSNDTYRYGYALITAVNNDKWETARHLVKAGASLNWVTTHDGDTCLHWAVKNKNSLMLELLLDHDANLSIKNKQLYTPMALAAHLKHWDMVNLIAKLKNMDIKDTYEYSRTLFYAVKLNQLDSVKCLIAADASVGSFLDSHENSALHKAVSNDDAAMVTLLLRHGAIVSKTNLEKKSALDFACSLGYWGIADLLLQDGHFTLEDSIKAGPAFIEATKAGQLTIAKKLLAAGVNVNSVDIEGNTVLHCAVIGRDVPLLFFALERGVGLTIQNNQGKTAIELASELGYWNIVQSLLEHNKNKSKHTVNELHYEKVLFNAITKSNYAIIKLLLKEGTPCDRCNSEMGNIALYLAVKHNEKTSKIVSLLLKYKANPTIKNKDAKNTFDFARLLKHQACLKRLEDYKKLKHSEELLTLKKTTIAPKELEKIRKDVSELYDFMCDNSLMANILPVSVQELITLQNTLLKNDYAILAARRDVLKSNPITQTHYLTQTFDMNSDLGRLNTVMHTINTLLNYPDQTPQINYLLNPYCAEENDIGLYITIKSNIANYVNRLHLFLLDLNFAIDSIQWKEKNFLGFWMDSKPDSIQVLQKTLSQLPKTPFTHEVLDVYKKVVSLLMCTFNKDDVHESTTQFYRDSHSQMVNMTFLPFTVPSTAQTTFTNAVDQLQPVYPLQTDYSPHYPLMTINPFDLDNQVSVSPYNEVKVFESHSLLGPVIQTSNIHELGFFSQTLPTDTNTTQLPYLNLGKLY